jgi:hypothetical protein
MTKGGAAAPDPRQTARDWITIWQSELTAAATDRELLEGLTRLINQWAQAAQAAATMLPAAPDAADGRARAGAAAGAEAADAAPDARDLAIERLARRVEELERVLAGLAARTP